VSGRLLSAAHAPPGVEHVSRRAEETHPVLPETRIGETGAAIGVQGAGEATRLAASQAVGRDDRGPVERIGTRWRLEP
jgi:hypothetical protein